MLDHLAVEQAKAKTTPYQVTLTCDGQSFSIEVSSSHGPTSLESRIQEVCGVPPGREPILSLPSSAWQVARQVVVTSSTGPSLHLTPPLRLSSDVEVCEGWQCCGGGGCSTTGIDRNCPSFVLGDGRCFVRGILYQLVESDPEAATLIQFGEGLFSEVIDPTVDYRICVEDHTLRLTARAFVSYAEANLNDLISRGDEPVAFDSREETRVPASSLVEEAMNEVILYHRALNEERLMGTYNQVTGEWTPQLSDEFYASEHIVRGAAIFHDRPLTVRADYRNGFGTPDVSHSEYGATITYNPNSNGGELFLNNWVNSEGTRVGVGTHFDLEHHPNLDSFQPSERSSSSSNRVKFAPSVKFNQDKRRQGSSRLTNTKPDEGGRHQSSRLKAKSVPSDNAAPRRSNSRNSGGKKSNEGKSSMSTAADKVCQLLWLVYSYVFPYSPLQF